MKPFPSCGRLLCATCSELSLKNQYEIARLLEKRPVEYELISQTNLLPSDTSYDGFHASLLWKM